MTFEENHIRAEDAYLRQECTATAEATVARMFEAIGYRPGMVIVPASRIEKLEAALKHCINALRQYEMGDDRPRGPIPNDDLRPWLLGAMDNAIQALEGKDD